MRVLEEDRHQVVDEPQRRSEDCDEEPFVVEILGGASDPGQEEHCRRDWVVGDHFDTE